MKVTPQRTGGVAGVAPATTPTTAKSKIGAALRSSKKVLDAATIRTQYFGVALLLTSVFSDLSSSVQPTNALSKSITTSCRPSVFRQLAGFLALEHNAEEEGLDTLVSHTSSSALTYGAVLLHEALHQKVLDQPLPSTKLTIKQALDVSGSLVRPTYGVDSSSTAAAAADRTSGLHVAAMTIPTTEAPQKLTSDLTIHSLSASSSSSRGHIVLPRTAPHENVEDLSSSSSTTSSSAGGHTASDSLLPSDTSLSSHGVFSAPINVAAVQQEGTSVAHPVLRAAVQWTQLHVSDLAMETGLTQFVHVTDGMLRRGLFPNVYRCFVDEVDIDLAAAATPTQRTTTHPSMSSNNRNKKSLAHHAAWRCTQCDKKHDVVRESCVQCRSPHPSPEGVTKVFVGQLQKELLCDDVMAKLIAATAPDVHPLRIEGHVTTGTKRGKGCGSVYVSAHDAERLVALLHRNVFMDVDWASGREVFYFAYSEQRSWLEDFAAARILVSSPQRPKCLPWQLLVCEVSNTTISNNATTLRSGVRTATH